MSSVVCEAFIMHIGSSFFKLAKIKQATLLRHGVVFTYYTCETNQHTTDMLQKKGRILAALRQLRLLSQHCVLRF